MGERFAADTRGRYEGKGGQQIGSLFPDAADYDKMKAIYGNNGFWSWLRYWWLDTENWITFLLLDKSSYDYDYTEPKPKANNVVKPRTREQVSSVLSRFGFATKLKDERKPILTPEQLQREVMGEM